MSPGTNTQRFLNLVQARGSNAVYHREDGSVRCPCVTTLGFRDPKWHKGFVSWVESDTTTDFAFDSQAGGSFAESDLVRYRYAFAGDDGVPVGPTRLTSAHSPAPGAGSIVLTIDPLVEYEHITKVVIWRSVNDGPFFYFNTFGVSVPAIHVDLGSSLSGGAQWLTGSVAPACNEEGVLPTTITHLAIKGFIQPVQSGATRRLTSDFIQQMFAEVQTDDHVGIFPMTWLGDNLDFQDWSQSGEDYILYNGRRFLVVNANLMPDPANGRPHHWETGLRLVKMERPTDG